MPSIAEKTDKMRGYFDTCIKMARGEAKDADGKPIPRGKRMIASIAGLCVEIGINKDDFYAMQCGNADEQAFFKDTMLRYEMAADAMLAAGMIDNGTYRTLREQFKETSVESEKIVQVVFSTWNAPDDWEDYKELQQAAKENGLQIRQLKKLLDKAIKAGLK